jgi:hypothetical protein
MAPPLPSSHTKVLIEESVTYIAWNVRKLTELHGPKWGWTERGWGFTPAPKVGCFKTGKSIALNGDINRKILYKWSV